MEAQEPPDGRLAPPAARRTIASTVRDRKGGRLSQLGLGLVDEVSNDLRQPITVIKGCVETVLSRWDELDPAQRRELLGAALEGTDHLVLSLEALEARLEAVDQAIGEARAAAHVELD